MKSHFKSHTAEKKEWYCSEMQEAVQQQAVLQPAHDQAQLRGT